MKTRPHPLRRAPMAIVASTALAPALALAQGADAPVQSVGMPAAATVPPASNDTVSEIVLAVSLGLLGLATVGGIVVGSAHCRRRGICQDGLLETDLAQHTAFSNSTPSRLPAQPEPCDRLTLRK